MRSRHEEFFSAAYSGDLDVLTRLLREGLDPNSRVDKLSEEYGSTALMYASTNNQPAAVRLLLASGADPNLGKTSPHSNAESDGRTALTMAAREGHEEVVRLLLAAGARPRPAAPYPGRPVRSALMSALSCSEPGLGAMVDAIVDAGGLEAGCVAAAAANGHGDLVDLLLKRGSDVNEIAGDTTPLLAAIGACRPDMVRFLLHRGADPNLAVGGWTPVKEAASVAVLQTETARNEVRTLLLAHGADAQDAPGWGVQTVRNVVTRLQASRPSCQVVRPLPQRWMLRARAATPRTRSPSRGCRWNGGGETPRSASC